MDSTEVALIKKVAVVQPEIVKFDDATIYYMWKKSGIELFFENTKLRTLFLHSEGSQEYSAYRGNLPQGLNFSDKRLDVERKLGAPDEIGGNNAIDVWVTYDKLKLGITYQTLDLNNMDAGIDHLSVQ